MKKPKEQEDKRARMKENIKFALLGALILAILVGSAVLIWQIDRQNKSAPASQIQAEEWQSQVAELNQKIDALNQALQDAQKEVKTETTVQVKETKSGSVSAPSASQSGSSDSPATSGGIININTASAAQLESLSGIGPVYAQRIIEYREANGGFKSIEEIQNVKGIGPKTFEKLRDRITI